MKLSCAFACILVLLMVALVGPMLLALPAQARPLEQDWLEPSEEPTADKPDGDLPLGVIQASGRTVLLSIPPPEDFSPLNAQAANITIRPLTGTSSRGHTCATWPTAAQTAFARAATIWANEVNSSVPILIDACWATNFTDPDNLGQGGPNNSYYNYVGSPRANTLYFSPLANALTGQDLSPGTAEIYVAYNSAFDTRGEFYYGTDGNTPANQLDFVTLVLHEIGHGIGFLGTMQVDSSNRAYWGGSTGYPNTYDIYAVNGAGQYLVNTFSNHSTALYAQLISNNIWFNGPNAKAANGGNRPRLDALSEWKQGSSFVHLDRNTYKQTANALMLRALDYGTAIHNIGPIFRGALTDFGWPSGSVVKRHVYLPVVARAQNIVPRPGYWRYANDQEMYVSTGSNRVVGFAVWVTVDSCGTYKIVHSAQEPIVNNQFGWSGSFYASGTFHSDTTASGTTGLDQLNIPDCGLISGGPWSWSATWRSSAQPAATAGDELVVEVVEDAAASDGAYEAVLVE
jgi:hypothetical protein